MLFCVPSLVCPVTGVSRHWCVVSPVCRVTGVSCHRCVVSLVCPVTGVSCYRCVVSYRGGAEEVIEEEEPKELGDPMAAFRARARKCEARDIFNSADVIAKAFEADWVSIQRGKGDAGLMALFGLKGDPAAAEILAKREWTCDGAKGHWGACSGVWRRQ